MATIDRSTISMLRCPTCSADITETSGGLTCSNGHSFRDEPIPDLRMNGGDEIAETFGEQWGRYEYGVDTTWQATLDERVAGFLDQIASDGSDLDGATVLDAGCGNGELTHEIATRFGCRVYGTDISPSVYRAHQRFGDRVSFFRSDLSRSAIKPGSFDIVYCGGVLHHTPDTRAAFAQLAPVAADRLFVWLYWRIPTRVYRAKTAARRLVAPLPSRVQQPIVDTLATASWIRHRCRGSFRDHRLVQHDFWTPRYRFEHTPDEVFGWLDGLGYSSSELRCTSRDGFGVLAYR